MPPADLAAAGLDAVFKVAFRFKVPLTPRAPVTATIGKRVPTCGKKLGEKRAEKL